MRGIGEVEEELGGWEGGSAFRVMGCSRGKAIRIWRRGVFLLARGMRPERDW